MSLLIGNKSLIAIESGITHAYESNHFKALGFFVIHIAGFCYGIDEPEAAMIGYALGEVKNRSVRRGTHTAPFSSETNAGEIADAIRHAIYAPDQEHKHFFGIPQPEFCKLIYGNNLMWDPGDETFDDSSYVLQFDVGDRVRLIAFKANLGSGNYHHNPATLRDLWLSADEFYGVLEQWREEHEAEWIAAQKLPDGN